MEKLGLCTVMAITDTFEMLAKVTAKSFGMPEVPVVVTQGPIAGISAEEVCKKADLAIDDLIHALMSTETTDKAEWNKTAYPAEILKFSVKKDDLFAFIYDKKWTDGLPVIPPTRKNVEAMLKGTSHNPDEIIDQLLPKEGIATIERVAINAVMAGCDPHYLPVVLAAVEAIADPDNNMGGWATTTGANSPMVIINGDIRDELDINYSTNALGTGRRANATIGRAINLIIRNIGGAIPGLTDMTTVGSPWEFTMCVAENEKALPPGWEAINSEKGFPNRNTVTVKSINSQIDIFSHMAPNFKQVLDTITAGIIGINSLAILQSQGIVIALCPEVADLAARDKWSKRELKQYLFENARQPLRNWKYLGDNWVARDLIPEHKNESEDYMIRMIPKPEEIIVFVTGGPGKHSLWWPGGHGSAVTKSIDKWR